MSDRVVVTFAGERRELTPGDILTFGRAESCSLCLDATDLGISRLAGSVEHEAGTWWLLNRSAVRALEIIDEIGIRTVLPPSRRVAISGTMTVVVEGSALRHAIGVATAVPDAFGAAMGTTSDIRPTATGEVVLNAADRLALVALFAGYLEPFPRYDPHPRSYADAATRLGLPRTTLVKRVEYLRTRLCNAGVPNLLGENALQHLAEWALTTGVLKRDDLDLLPPR
ncbi:MAG: hypothetical protein M3Y91_06315 [Actinomycetota bacterium]|nr:hypothetical protein [Actinomycetota bacterium]